MKLYNVNDLFVGSIGNTSDRGTKLHIENVGYTITRRTSKGNCNYYVDILSNTFYLDFHDSHCNKGGQIAIYEPKSLLLYMQKIYNDTITNEKIYEIATKIINLKQISELEINTLIRYLNNKESFDNSNEHNSYLTILNDKKFINEPAIAVDDKLTDIMVTLASNEKNPILIGNIGTGRNTLINEIVYRIQKNNCPKFLKKVNIIDITKLISLNSISKEFADDINSLINFNTNKTVIFVVKNIHALYTSNSQLANLIKNSIDESNIKVIGITTLDKYNELKTQNNLSKNFTEIFVDEPNSKMLYEIINKVFNDYSKNNKISLFDDMEYIIDLLIDLTKEENRIWNSNMINLNTDIVYNPKLVIQIIDLIFAHAKVNNQNKLKFDNIKYAINKCDKLKEEIKEEYISKLDRDLKEKTRTISFKHLGIFYKE